MNSELPELVSPANQLDEGSPVPTSHVLGRKMADTRASHLHRFQSSPRTGDQWAGGCSREREVKEGVQEREGGPSEAWGIQEWGPRAQWGVCEGGLGLGWRSKHGEYLYSFHVVTVSWP